MAPKKAKAGENVLPYWHTIIEETILDEDTWKVKVFMIDAAESDVDRIYLNKFETFSTQEKRFVVKNICKTETIFMINQLGSEKKVKDENMLIFEEAESYLREKKEIPTEVYALIIKHLILNMKDEYLFIKKAKLELKEGLRQESQTMLKKEELRGTVSAKHNEPPPPKLPSAKNAPVVENTPQPVVGKKYNTNLRVRGEEWRDKVYVDDFPLDGPNLYVAVSGFMDPLLAGCLIKIGVPLSAVIKISVDPSATNIPVTLNPPTKRGQSQTDIFAEKSTKFWSDIQQVRLHKDTTDIFVNTAFIIFSPPYWTNDQLSGNPEQIYDELSNLMYDVQDLTRQHSHYLENMKIINVPENTESTVLNKRYHRKIDDLPLESVTLYSVINSILESVCNVADTHENDYESRSSETTDQRSGEDLKILKAKTFVKKVFNTLCKTDCNKAYRVTYGEEYENQREPIVINYGDYAKYKTFHLDHVNLNPVVTSSLYRTPINNLWHNRELPNEELEAKIDFHYNVLLSCFDREDVENNELNRLLHILACRKLFNNRSSLKKNHLPEKTIDDFKKSYLKRTKLAEPLPIIKASSKHSCGIPSPVLTNSDTVITSINNLDSDSRIKYLFECPDLTELVSAAEISIQAAIGHVIDSYEYFEDFNGVSALQTIFDAYNTYNCVDYKYCEVTDTFILMFFNSHNNEGISHYEWRNHLVSPVCLHDFFDFVLEEEYEWIKKEEQIYDENMMLRSLSLLRDSMEVLAKSCIDNTDIADELLMEGSLKHQVYVKKIQEQDQEEIVPSTTVLSGKTEKTGPTTIESEKTSALKSPKNPKGQKTTNIKENEEKEESEDGLVQDPKPFVGFDVGNRRVEVFGKDSTFYSKDGTKVSSSYTLFIPSNLEYVSLCVVPGTTKTEFCLHKALGEYASQEALNMSECLRITTKNQISIYLKKEEFTIPIVVENEDTFNATQKLTDPLPPLGNESIIVETRHFYSFIKTWPNGLITESVFEENSDKISHIKQFHIKPLLNLSEDKRCVSLNGEVIIFKTNHDIEVLRPDGTFILVTKVIKKRIKTEADDQITSSRMSKYFKPTSSSKLSKKNLDDEFEDPTAEYQIHIKEYEIIETNGLRQKWVDDESNDIEKLIIKTATDYCLGEVFTRRMDGTSTLLNKDGLLVVTFPNNTRIISSFVIEQEEIFPEWTEEEIDYLQLFDIETTESEGLISQKSAGTHTSMHSRDENIGEEENSSEKNKDGFVSIQLVYTIEHANFATVTINKALGEITIDSPNNVSVNLNTEKNYKISLDSSTSASFDGSNLQINHEACTECGSCTSCEVAVANPDEVMSLNKAKNWLTLKDSYNKKIVVTDEGTLYVDDSISSSQEIFQEDQEVRNAINAYNNTSEEKSEDPRDAKSESSIAAHEKCENNNETKSVRFFVLRRDLTCSELLHSALVEEYKHKCRWQPWCSITEHDTFGDNRKLHSIILPINLTESEKWMLDSKLADKPKYLTYKDLKTDEGKGFYHWMRPYPRFKPQPRKPSNVLPPRQPRAFVLRTLEKQWNDANQDALAGAKELITAILKYRKVLEQDSASLLTAPIRDFRTEAEATTDQIIADIGKRILVEDLKKRLKEDLTESVQPSITTKPPPPPAHEEFEESVEEEWPEYTGDEEQSPSLKELNEAVPVSPALAKYWRQREEEYKEEQLYRYLLRDGTVPPYFQNVLGGAIWWEANNLATEAVAKAERNKIKCPCFHVAEEVSSASRTYKN